MPWARIPSDRLQFMNQFGYELEHQDGKMLWYRGPDGLVYCVDKYAPRFWFDSVGEAVQAGCVAVRLKSEAEIEEAEAAFAAAATQKEDSEGDDPSV